MDLGLVFDHQLMFCLRSRVTLEVDLKAMCRLQWTISGRVNGSFEIRVLCLMDSGQKIKVTFAVPLLPE